MYKLSHAIAALALPMAMFAACGGKSSTDTKPPTPGATADAATGVAEPAPPPPTVEEAKAFVAEVDRELRRLWVNQSKAEWAKQTNITDETEALPKGGLAATFPFRGERDHMQSFGDELRYILSSQVERMTANLFPSSYRDLIKYAEKRGLFEVFGEWESDGMAPFTFIDFEARERELHIHAFRAFPGSTTLLKTQSIFEVGPVRDPELI